MIKKQLLLPTLIVFLSTLMLFNLARADDDLLIKTRAAYDKKNQIAVAEYARMLNEESYLLAPYADYWLMLLKLSSADNAEVAKFIESYADYPFADRVRGEWIKKLAKQEDWQTILAEMPKYQRDDVAVGCAGLMAQQQMAKLDDTQIATLRKFWLNGAIQPAPCEALFSLQINAGVISQEDIWRRMRLALVEGKLENAKSLALKLSSVAASHIKWLDKADQTPETAVNKNLIPLGTRFGREATLYAISRAGKKSTESALDMILNIKSKLSDEEFAYACGRVAVESAKRHEEVAAELFSKAKNTNLDEDQHAWKVRAYLITNDWAGVESAVKAMPAEQALIPAWRYWLGRSLLEQGKPAEANMIFVQLSKEHHFYGLLALEALGDVISAPSVTYTPTQDELKVMASVPGIQRALALQAIDMRAEARQEWIKATETFDDKQMITAAELAARNDWVDNAISTAEKTKTMHNFALRYPMPHLETMKAYAKVNQLDEAWVYGLIRQESRFIKLAKSRVGASGLMQVMPATAKWIANRLGEKAFKQHMIHELDTNVKYGTHYLRFTMDKMDGQAVMATAAYNAGPGRPKRWALSRPVDAEIYAELIPFNETREYVKKVMANAHYYAERLGKPRQTLRARMGVVPAVTIDAE
jgi:soluble lytic murein transglycosylase